MTKLIFIGMMGWIARTPNGTLGRPSYTRAGAIIDAFEVEACNAAE